MNDIVVNKIQSVQRCVERARQEYQSDPAQFVTRYSQQDAAVLNVLRACEQTIDLANHLIQTHKMGIPSASAESFDLLQRKQVIDSALSERLKRMVHFRNIAIHQYQQMELEIVTSVIVSGLDDLVLFCDQVKAFLCGPVS
jgi:uncharacterized protein YutE (UPF0331/DUF86 family)